MQTATTHRTTIRVADVLLVAGLCVIGGFAALLAFAHLPWRVGRVPLPVSVVPAALIAWWLPRPAFRLTGSLLAAAAPAAAMLGALVVLHVVANPLYPAPPRVVLDNWRSLLLLAAVAMAGAASCSLLWAQVSVARNRAVSAGSLRADGSGPVGVTRRTPAGWAGDARSAAGTGDTELSDEKQE